MLNLLPTGNAVIKKVVDTGVWVKFPSESVNIFIRFSETFTKEAFTKANEESSKSAMYEEWLDAQEEHE